MPRSDEKTQKMRPIDKNELNIHYWLRQVFLYVWLAQDKDDIKIQERINAKTKASAREAESRNKREEKGIHEELEMELRQRLWNGKETISRKDALIACEQLYKMLMEPLSERINTEIMDPDCPGGMPQAYEEGDYDD